MLKKGDIAPDFSLPSNDGSVFKLSSMRGKRVVLYFYPKDATPGCTTEAEDFTALVDQFAKINTVVIGVSPDSVESHKKFIEKSKLKITLLADVDKSVATSYSAYGEKKLYGKISIGIIRSTFIIGSDGKLEETYYNVKATGHADRVYYALKQGKL